MPTLPPYHRRMGLFRPAGATAFAALLASGTVALAQTAVPSGADAVTSRQTAAIDRIAESVIDRKGTPSVAIAVAKHGRLVFAKAYGYRNLDDRVPADVDTAYGIGSNTKQFTAACILMLRDQAKLDVDAPVGRYLPGIAHGDVVTVRELLTHTGGYAEYTELDDFDRLAARPATSEEILRTIVDRPLSFTPGTKWQYSNTGYVILTAVIERLSGMRYADFLRTRIFEPLGMTRTHYEDESAVEPDRATGYTRFAMGAQEHEQHIDYSWFDGAGAIVSTLADLERWNEAIDRGTLLSASSREMMHTSMKLADGTDTHYGMGLLIGTLPDGKHVIYHGGDTTGFGSQDARYVEDGVDVIVLTNQEPAIYNAIMRAVYRVVVPETKPGPAPTLAAPLPAPSSSAIPYAKHEVDVLARRWLEDAIAGKIDLAKLRSSARAQLRIPAHQAALRSLAAYGPRSYTLLAVDRRAPTSTYQYLLRTRRRTLIYVFVIDDDGQLGGGDVFDPDPLAPE
jgi:D-alanyl-D-alanine carboxypeptidase